MGPNPPTPNRTTAARQRAARRCTHAPARGLTLVEAVIALVLMLAVVSLLMPRLVHRVIGPTVADTSQDLMADLERARREAVARREPVELLPTAGDWQHGWTVRAGATALSQHAGSPAVRIDGAPAQIRFGPQGTLLGARRALRMTVRASPESRPASASQAEDQARCVSVDGIGRTRTVYGACR